ncbi:MAG: type II secretion system protein [Gemmataceae bacterium]
MCYSRRAWTLVELMVVLVILGTLAALVMPLLSGSIEETKYRTTLINMHRVRDAIMGTSEQPGYLADVGALPLTLDGLHNQPVGVLAWDRNTRRGWNGPYLTGTTIRYLADEFPYGVAGDLAVADGWGWPIILQYPGLDPTNPVVKKHARLVSLGPNGQLETPLDLLPSPAALGDDTILFLYQVNWP